MRSATPGVFVLSGAFVESVRNSGPVTTRRDASVAVDRPGFECTDDQPAAIVPAAADKDAAAVHWGAGTSDLQSG